MGSTSPRSSSRSNPKLPPFTKNIDRKTVAVSIFLLFALFQIVSLSFNNTTTTESSNSLRGAPLLPDKVASLTAQLKLWETAVTERDVLITTLRSSLLTSTISLTTSASTLTARDSAIALLHASDSKSKARVTDLEARLEKAIKEKEKAEVKMNEQASERGKLLKEQEEFLNEHKEVIEKKKEEDEAAASALLLEKSRLATKEAQRADIDSTKNNFNKNQQLIHDSNETASNIHPNHLPLSHSLSLPNHVPLIEDFATTTTLLIFTFRRSDYLPRTLNAILRYIPNSMRIVISQDGKEPAITAAIEEFRSQFTENGNPFFHIRHPQTPSRDNSYMLLSQHYNFGLDSTFSGKAYGNSVNADEVRLPTKRVIILEEDLEIAPDFFSFFHKLAPMLDDPKEKLLCVSAWNDNGMKEVVSDPHALVRSDFFPGLGWMLTAKLWNELKVKWPNGYWDDWLREPPQRKGREIIRPEVSRTYHFGQKGGASHNVYSGFLERVKLNDEDVDWNTIDLSYLKKRTYDVAFKTRIEAATEVKADEVHGVAGDKMVIYHSLSEGRTSFERLAKVMGIFDNVKAGVPRGAYKGVVGFRENANEKKAMIFLMPPKEDIVWDKVKEEDVDEEQGAE